MNGRDAPCFAVLTPLMKSREPRAGWFAFATDVDNLRMIRWRLSRELMTPPGCKPFERLKLSEATCTMLDEADARDWSRDEVIGHPKTILEAGAMVVARFDALTTFRLTGETPPCPKP